MPLVHRDLEKIKAARELKEKKKQEQEQREKALKEIEAKINEKEFLSSIILDKAEIPHIECNRRIRDLEQTLHDLLLRKELEIPIEPYNLWENRLMLQLSKLIIREAKIFKELIGLDIQAKRWNILDFQDKLKKNVELLEAFHNERPYDDIRKYRNKRPIGAGKRPLTEAEQIARNRSDESPIFRR